MLVLKSLKNYSPQKTLEIIKDVEAFSKLNDFLRRSVKTYSAGMQARLAFGISTAVHPEILILDEMISAGDAHFIHKAQERMHHTSP